MAQIAILQAQVNQAEIVSSILQEAANWLISIGMPLWQPADLAVDNVRPDVEAGLFWIAWARNGSTEPSLIESNTSGTHPDSSQPPNSFPSGFTPAGCLRFQLEDPFFWPDVPSGESAFIHRLAVRRDFAGGRVADALINWARQQATRHGRRYLRLDCHPRRELRQVYERRGFVHHSDRRMGSMVVARYQSKTAQ